MSLTSYQRGRLGEEIAAEYLQERGYKIVQRNLRILRAEIDIVAKQNDTVIFVEVKTRSNEEYGSGVEYISQRKQNQCIKAAMAYMKKGEGIRFDVISILLDPKTKSVVKIQHIRNAFSCK